MKLVNATEPHSSELLLGLRPANERRGYIVQTYNQCWSVKTHGTKPLPDLILTQIYDAI